MKNIIRIFKHDLARIRKTTIGLAVVVGLVVVPVLYAWFNIAGSWDPYANTNGIKVAVANTDAGYQSKLMPLSINMGDQVVSALRANDQMGWTFVSEDEAIEGVKSGAYYAAVVIPKDFSANLLTLFSQGAKSATITYYENQKASAIAPRVTGAGASTVRQQIDETFTGAVDDIALAAASGLLDYLDSDEVAQYAARVSQALDASLADLTRAAGDAGSFASLSASLSSSLDASAQALGATGTVSDQARGALKDAQAGILDVKGALQGTADQIDDALAKASGSFDAAASSIDGAFDAAGDHVGITVAQLRSVAGDITADAQKVQGLAADVRAAADAAENLGLHIAAHALRAAASDLDRIASQQLTVADHIAGVASDLESGANGVEASRAEAQQAIAQAKEQIKGVQGSYDEQLATDVDNLGKATSDVATAAAGIASQVRQVAQSLGDTATSLAHDMGGVNHALGDAAGALNGAVEHLTHVKSELDAALHTGDVQKIRDLIGGDPTTLASALAAPVSLDRHNIYPIDNYGSAMAPFYTVLSLWVGGVVLAAMLKVDVDRDFVAQLDHVRQHELYLGRFCLFGMLALLQATLVGLGDIYFLGIQCQDPLGYLAAAWLTALVFSAMIYTLTVSFGDIGKALAVVLLVMQVAGSGGTFPIQMTADFFQAVFPWLPFTHAIGAMHAAIAGSYGAEYLREIAVLALYLIPTLALGLVLRRPVMRANAWIIEKLEETKLM